MLLSRICLFLFSIALVATANGQVVDVYFITGQSNGGNLSELNSFDPQGYMGLNQAAANRTPQAFELDFARIFDRTSTAANTGLDEVFHQFSGESELDTTQFALDRLALGLNDGASRIAIFSYCRNGRPLFNATTDNGESWFPGNDPANGDVFNDELYGYFSDWSATRIAELEAQGLTINVRGIFWFQGEGDVGIGAAATSDYEQNFQRLVDRFRVDFGADVPVVATEIRIVGNTATQALQNEVNDAMAAVAAVNPGVSVVTTQDLTPVSAADVHFTGPAYFQLADRWAAEIVGKLPPPRSGNQYQDAFDNDGLGVNTGVGGGGISESFNNGPSWTDDGTLTAGNAGAGFHIWRFRSLETFEFPQGFTMEVVFDQLFDDNNGSNASVPFNANHFSFGLSTPNASSNFLNTNGANPDSEGIGVSLTNRSGNVDIGLLETDLSAGTTTTLDPFTSSTVGVGQVFTLSVDSSGNYNWNLNGVESGSGTTALDLTQAFHFVARTQASTGNRIQSISIVAGDIVPTSFTRLRGVEVSSDLSDFLESDDQSAVFQPGFVVNVMEAPIWLIFDGNGPAATNVQIESTADTTGLTYTVEAFNWASGQYDVIGIQSETFNSDQILQFAIVPDDHIDTDGDLRTRVGWRQTGFALLFPWSVNVDQLIWTQ